MAQNIYHIPEGFHTVTPYMIVPNALRAMDLYGEVFGAEQITRMPGPGGPESTMHAEMQIGDSRVMLSDENPQLNAVSPAALGGSPVSLHVYVENVDDVYEKAVDAGFESTFPVQDMFWGDRYAKLTDPYGHTWGIATRKEIVSPEELEKRQAAMLEEMGGE